MINSTSLDAYMTNATGNKNINGVGDNSVVSSIDTSIGELDSRKELSSPLITSSSPSLSGSPISPSIPRGLVDLVDIVGHYLRTDNLCRENDLYLILRVCEYKGFVLRRRLHNNKSALFFLESDILSGKIPRSFFDTVRRTRQKLQQQEPGLRPCEEFYNARQGVSEAYRKGIVGRLEEVK